MRRSRRTMAIGALMLAACEQGASVALRGLKEAIAAQKTAIEALQRRAGAFDASLAALEAAAPPVEAPQPTDRVRVSNCDDDRCFVTRSEVEALFVALAYDLESMRLVPKTRGEEAVGIELFDIPEFSRIRHYGLRDGDLVRSIAGIEAVRIASMQSLEERVRELESFTVVGEREGVLFELTFEVREPKTLPSLNCERNRCTVERAELEALLDDPLLPRHATPHRKTENGTVIGFSVGVLSEESVLKQLGLQRFDVVRAVGGLELTRREVWPELKAKLLEPRWTIALSREGEPFEITVEVKP